MPAKRIFEEVEAQPSHYVRGRGDYRSGPKATRQRAREGVGTAAVPGQERNHESARLIDRQDARVGLLGPKVRRDQARHGTGGEEENQLVIALKPGANRIGQRAGKWLFPGIFRRAVRRRIEDIPAAQALPRRASLLDPLARDRNEGDVLGCIHGSLTRRSKMGCSGSRQFSFPNGRE